MSAPRAHSHDHSGHSHGHHQGHSRHPGPSVGGRWIWGVALNLGFVVVEVVFGLIGRSTALLADAGHNLSDVLGLAMAGVAAWLARRPASARRTYGWGKATVLAALANAVALVFASGLIASEAFRRIGESQAPSSAIMMAVAAAGVLVNGSSALLFLRGQGDANVRAAFLHLVGDAAVAAGVIVAGGLIYLTGAAWIDPVASLLVVAIILFGTWGLLKEAFALAVDAAPSAVNPSAVRELLAARPGVLAVHDLHVWAMSTTEVALTAHIVRPEGADDGFLHETCEALREEFGIEHATLQVETDKFDACARMHG